MGLLAALELVALTAADEAATSDRAQLVTNLCSIPVLLLGVALVVAGVVALRTGRTAWSGAPWLGPFVAGRLGIGGWMALFAVLGLGLTRLDATIGDRGCWGRPGRLHSSPAGSPGEQR